MREVLLLIGVLACLTGRAAAQDGPGSTLAVPLVELERGRVEVTWIRGPGGQLTASMTLHAPTLHVARQPDPAPAEPVEPPRDPGAVVRDLAPFPVELDQLAIHDGSIVFVDDTVPGREVLRVRQLEVTIENFASHRRGAGGLPTLVAATGWVGSGGRFELFATVNPWTDELDFAGRAQVVGLELRDLDRLIAQEAGVRPTQGTATVFVEFSVERGRIEGAVKPLLADVEVAPTSAGVADRLRAWLVGGAVTVLSTEVGDRDTVATTVPFRGELHRPDLGMWRAIIGVLSHAFIEGLTVGFADLPPGS